MTLDLTGKEIVIVGMARSGLAAAEFLWKRGARVTVSDNRPAAVLESEARILADRQIRYETGGHSWELFGAADLIVVSPGVPLSLPILRQATLAGREIISEIELASRFLKGKVIAITGTNGKTTTTALTGEILRTAGFHVQVGGNIGTPLISLVDSSTPETWSVVELSSFQLEAVPTFRPDIAVILNLTPDHLDRYASFEAYAQAKLKIFQNQIASDFAVVNQEDASLQKAAENLHSQVFWFSGSRKVGRGTHAGGGDLIFESKRGSEVVMACNEVPLKGQHNIENVAAAITSARLAGVQSLDIAKGVRNFKGVEHRLEPVAEINGVRFFNDSKATNVDATIKALEAFDSGIILILGGRDKGGDFRVLGRLIQGRVKSLVLLGEASEKIRAQLEGVAPMSQAGSMEQAVELAFQQAEAGNTVLLAPACASFDMFQNYEHRGREFKAAVKRLREGMP
ncbi:MAG: UDP-N-acetylmuramoyl-L-alanine--D-glutamate ligase [Acidobacteria bacterium]|nr:UDP-N-acetylmuramoyl-L-alanine--D-glutamate ligase [Acidobacteriota bacterium]MCI0621323.1 UDP-N-acetylmuramoyl-L-alanine--D-glutamate ligase [Acidobacteriota bacterium]MCI0720131.1 UDP-N-acetylmuramoyl-L-alanine--D-glutamate ligase [Acidobacteriota bacterium]